jgi:hypothetical protein
MARTQPPLAAHIAAVAENTVKSVHRSSGAYCISEKAMRRLLNQDLSLLSLKAASIDKAQVARKDDHHSSATWSLKTLKKEFC